MKGKPTLAVLNVTATIRFFASLTRADNASTSTGELSAQVAKLVKLETYLTRARRDISANGLMGLSS